MLGVLVLVGLRAGLTPISDNSMLLHLKTGVTMLHTGTVPSRDPYSFTAPGHAWVVQSWLAELTYGIAHAVGGYHAVVIEQGLLMAAVAGVIGWLARAGAAGRTAVAAGAMVIGGIPLWSQRPLMFGLLALAATVVIVDRRLPAWILIPVVWVWVNTHGSFPLGVAWLGAVYVGSWLDGRARPRALDRHLVCFVAGLALAAINPVGPKLIAFPLVVEGKHTVFANIIEWKSPNFQSGSLPLTLLMLAVGLGFVLRRGAPWRDVIPVAGLVVAGLISERNLPAAFIVLAPVLGRALALARTPAVAPTRTRFAGGRFADVPLAVPMLGLAFAGVGLVVLAMKPAPIDLHSYPEGAERYMAAHHLLAERVAAPDLVGDYRVFVEPPADRVFIDDRFDMYPQPVVDDLLTLIGGRSPALSVLDRWRVGAVLWQRGEGPVDIMLASGKWKTVYSDKTWMVLVRTTST